MSLTKSNKEIYYKYLEDPRWIAKSKEIKSKFGWKCQKCGAIDKPLHCHHQFYVNDPDGRRLPWEYPNETFQVFCNDCHYGLHDQLREYRKLKFEKSISDQRIEFENKINSELLAKEFDICLYCSSNGSNIENGVCCDCQCKGKKSLDVICKQCNGFYNKIYGCMFHLAPMIKQWVLHGFCSVCVYNCHKTWLESRSYTSSSISQYQKRRDFNNFVESMGVIKVKYQSENCKELPWYVVDQEKSRIHRNSHGIISPRHYT